MPFDISVLPAFLAASFVLLITPGPDVAFIVATGITEGRRPALWASTGCLCDISRPECDKNGH